MFFGLIGKTRWQPWPRIGWDIFNFSSETIERNSTKLDKKQDLTFPTKFVFFGPRIGKWKWRPLSLIGWDIFDFSSETTVKNSGKVDRKQDFNILYQVCVIKWPAWSIRQKCGTLYSGARYVAHLASCCQDVRPVENIYQCVCPLLVFIKGKLSCLSIEWSSFRINETNVHWQSPFFLSVSLYALCQSGKGSLTIKRVSFPSILIIC